jgi:hypothetical protein
MRQKAYGLAYPMYILLLSNFTWHKKNTLLESPDKQIQAKIANPVLQLWQGMKVTFFYVACIDVLKKTELRDWHLEFEH